jgi:hypothetical protein
MCKIGAIQGVKQIARKKLGKKGGKIPIGTSWGLCKS